MRQFTSPILAIFVAVSVISQQSATPDAREPLTREAFTRQVQSLEQRVQSTPADADARGALLQLYGTESIHFMPPGEASKALVLMRFGSSSTSPTRMHFCTPRRSLFRSSIPKDTSRLQRCGRNRSSRLLTIPLCLSRLAASM